jgi:hypothetical protein
MKVTERAQQQAPKPAVRTAATPPPPHPSPPPLTGHPVLLGVAHRRDRAAGVADHHGVGADE